METLHGFPNVSSIASHKLVFSPPRYSLKAFCCRHLRRGYVSCSCHAFASENPGDTNNGKSNEDLRNEIREFLSSAALPENHVPSLRELLQHNRTSQLWSAVLYLYPGIYEIKFVVDGRWNLHPKMEKVLREFTYNNILRVD